MAAFHNIGMAVLLISCDVNPKWIHSFISSSDFSNLFFKKYSTALTSCLVVFSISFICIASSSEKPSAILHNLLAEEEGRVNIFFCDKYSRYSTSTKTLHLINAYSEKYSSRL